MQGYKKRRYGILINLVIILGIMGIVNFISADYFWRWDLTENKSYSVTSSTRNVLKRLDDIVSIKVYCSKKLPTQLEQVAGEIRDTLNEYQAYAGSKLQVEWIDPAENKDEEQKVQRLGIPQLQASIIEQDKRELVNIYMGIGIFYADRKEILPAVTSVANLEYDLTSSILKVLKGKLKKLCFLTGHGEHTISSDYSTVKQSLEKNYEITTVDTSDGTKIPDDVETLIIAGPNELSDRDKYEIDQFLMQGKNVFFLIDSVNVSTEVFMALPKSHKLNDLLENYGVRLNNNLVLDWGANSIVTFGSQYVQFSTNYPPWPKVVHDHMAPNNPIVSRLETVAFPWISSIEINKDRIPDMEVTELLKTTPKSTEQKDNFNIDAQRLPRPNMADLKQYLLAAIIRGKFKSFFSDKPIPAPKPASDKTPLPAEADKNRQTVKECANPATIMVIGDSDFISNQLLSGGREGNLPFILNAVDWATMGGDLIGIRAKDTELKPLKETSPATKLLCKVLNIGLVPFLFILYGLVRLLLRHREKKAVEEVI
ncbi:MAG: Gldg family protein [Planctomycetes bacterium]|nr:Gldg family protein [Planctomycetota bacterium]